MATPLKKRAFSEITQCQFILWPYYHEISVNNLIVIVKLQVPVQVRSSPVQSGPVRSSPVQVQSGPDLDLDLDKTPGPGLTLNLVCHPLTTTKLFLGSK